MSIFSMPTFIIRLQKCLILEKEIDGKEGLWIEVCEEM